LLSAILAQSAVQNHAPAHAARVSADRRSTRTRAAVTGEAVELHQEFGLTPTCLCNRFHLADVILAHGIREHRRQVGNASRFVIRHARVLLCFAIFKKCASEARDNLILAALDETLDGRQLSTLCFILHLSS
jgi:hypothetical protein